MSKQASRRRPGLLETGGEPSSLLTFVLLLVLLAVGGALRLQAASERYAPDPADFPDVQRYYLGVADSFLAGDGWVPDYEENFIPPPGQAAFVVLCRTLIPGSDLATLRMVQAALSVLTLLLAFHVGQRLGGRWTGIAALAVVAFDRNVIAYTGNLLAENNYFFLMFGFLALLLEAVHRRTLPWMIAAGYALALTSLTKPFPMLLSVLVPVYLVARHRDRRSLRNAAAFFLGFAILVSPWLVRNSLRYGQLYPISTNSGTLLAQSNFVGLDPTDRDQIYWESIYREAVWKDPAIEARFEGATDRYGRKEWNEKDRAYMRHALRYMASHPLHFARNYAFKLHNVLRYPLPEEVRDWRPSHYYRVALLLLGLPGLAWFAVTQRRKPHWVLVPVIGYYLAFGALLHIVRSGRMNLPLKVLIGLCAAWLLARAAATVLSRVAGPGGVNSSR